MKAMLFSILSIICLCLAAPAAQAANCLTPYSFWYSGPDICWYYGSLTVTAGPTDCKLPGATKSQATATCAPGGTPKNSCNIDLKEKVTKKYKLTGNISPDGFGLGAEYESETVTESACKIDLALEVDCSKCVKPADQTCCKEAFEVQRSVTKRRDVIECIGSGFDTGECNSVNPSCDSTTVACTEEGTLKTILNRNCSDCSSITDCQ